MGWRPAADPLVKVVDNGWDTMRRCLALYCLQMGSDHITFPSPMTRRSEVWSAPGGKDPPLACVLILMGNLSPALRPISSPTARGLHRRCTALPLRRSEAARGACHMLANTELNDFKVLNH